MKKAQSEQIFVYILAMVIMGFTLLYGYRYIMMILETQKQAELIRFNTALKTEISSIGSDYGSVRRKSFSVPAGYRQLCFVDIDSLRAAEGPDGPAIAAQDAIGNPYGLIRDYVLSMLEKNAEQKNMFLFPPGVVSYYVGNITIHTDFMCVNVTQNRITLLIEGLGNRANISAVP